MARSKNYNTNNSSNNEYSTMNNGGIMGSGIFGMFGSTVHCKAEDDSMYCNLTKFVNIIMMIFFIIFVIYLIYIGFNYFTSGKKK
jgi:hypothetical protein